MPIDGKVWPIRVGYKVCTNVDIILSDANTLIRYDPTSVLKKATVFEKVGKLAPGTRGEIVDYGDHEIAVKFASGLDWSTFTIWITRGAFGVYVTNTGPD